MGKVKEDIAVTGMAWDIEGNSRGNSLGLGGGGGNDENGDGARIRKLRHGCRQDRV